MKSQTLCLVALISSGMGMLLMPKLVYNITRLNDILMVLHMCMQATKVTRDMFRHQAISDIMKKQWFGARQKNFHARISSEDFRSVPDNMICLVCNAVSVGTQLRSAE